MNTRVTLDKAGRIVIPKPMRAELHLQPGDALELESQNMAVTLRPVRSTTRLKKERGVWVFNSGSKLTAEDSTNVLKDMREQRHRPNNKEG